MSTAKEAVCPTCDLEGCICLPGMKYWLKDESVYYKDNFGVKQYWPKARKNEKEELVLECRLCSTYNENVHFASRNGIARGSYVIKKPNGGCLKDHVKNEKGDHQKCLDNFLKATAPPAADAKDSPEAALVVGGAVKDRASEKPSMELLNHMSWLSVALTLPASERQFGTMVRTAQHTGATVVADQYQSDHFFKEGLESMVRILNEEVVTVFNDSRKIAWHMDVGGGALLIRLYCLNKRFERCTHFWEARKVGSHTSEGLFQAFLHSCSRRGEFKIAPEEVWKKTCLLLGDGASVNGVRHKGKSAPTAVAGNNLFHKMQQECDKVLSEAGIEKSLPIIGYWCDNHELDLTSAQPERQIEYVANLMHFFRSIITHVMQSDRAQGLLDYISLMVRNQQRGGLPKGQVRNPFLLANPLFVGLRNGHSCSGVQRRGFREVSHRHSEQSVFCPPTLVGPSEAHADIE